MTSEPTLVQIHKIANDNKYKILYDSAGNKRRIFAVLENQDL